MHVLLQKRNPYHRSRRDLCRQLRDVSLLAAGDDEEVLEIAPQLVRRRPGPAPAPAPSRGRHRRPVGPAGGDSCLHRIGAKFGKSRFTTSALTGMELSARRRAKKRASSIESSPRRHDEHEGRARIRQQFLDAARPLPEALLHALERAEERRSRPRRSRTPRPARSCGAAPARQCVIAFM